MALGTDIRAVLAACVVVFRPVHRYQQHTDHGDRDEGRTGGTWSRLGGIQFRAVLWRPVAPWLAGVLGEQIASPAFWVGAAAVFLAAGVLAATRRHLVGIDAEESELDEITDRAESVTVGSELISA